MLELETFQRRRSMCRLFFLFKVVQGLVPAINPEEYLKPQKQKRRIKSRKYENFKSVNIVEKHSVNHDRGYDIEQCHSEQLKKIFFIKTLLSGTILNKRSCMLRQ